jgi:uncharacterized protein YjbI with pentapeptide repeats
VAKRAAKPATPDPQAVARTKFFEQGTDPVIAKKALEDATAVSRALWLSFLTFGTYLVITFAGVTHRDLLLETPIKLPVLNAPLPLVTFFWVAPILFVIFHLYLLLSLKLLADQVHSYVGHMEEVGLDTDAQDRARLQLPNFVVVQVLGGTSGQVNSWAGRLMYFTAFLTLVAGPLILLLFAQLMFLPYHGWGVTMAQRVMVVVDLVFIWYFWRAMMRPEREGSHVWSGLASAAVVILTFFGFMYPGEKFYGALPQSIFVETNWEFVLKFRDGDGWDSGYFYNTLMLAGGRLVDEELYRNLEKRNHEKGINPWQGERSLEIRKGRDFRNADFNNVDLRKADLSYSDFTGANFGFASLQGTTFYNAKLQHAAFVASSLQGASLSRVSAQFSAFELTSMEGTLLDNAKLQGASFIAANLDGASLENSSLQATFLFSASLVGASLQGAALQNVYLNDVSLLSATFDGASLEGIHFGNEHLDGVSLKGASVWRNTGNPDISTTDVSKLAILTSPHEQSGYQFELIRGQYELWVAKALDGVGAADVKVIRDKLASLDPTAVRPIDFIHWNEIVERKTFEFDLELAMVEKLTIAACSRKGAPYVARSIIKVRLGGKFSDIPKQYLTLIEKLLKGCDGTVGIDNHSVDRLNELKAFLTLPEEKPTSGFEPNINKKQ